MKNINRFSSLLIISIIVALSSCNTNPNAGALNETPTRGKIKIGVDQSYKLLLDTEIYTFHSIYPDASITPLYKPELDILNDLFNDSVRLIITSRQLTKEEMEYMNSKRLEPHTTKIAYDALAFIVNKNNPDSLLKYTDIKNIFTGKTSSWKQINPKTKNGQLKVVFDNNKSGNVRFIKEKFSLKEELPAYCYAVDSNQEVINYVERNPNALGVVSVNWISDKHDSVSHSFLKRIRVVAVTSEYDPDGYDYYKPYQGYVADKSYPFIREVYIISRESFWGLGTGFASFVAGDKGQRIILKSRMVPATMPIRLIQTRSN